MDDAEFRKLLDAAPPLVLVASRKKGFLFVLGAVLMVAGSLALVYAPGVVDKIIGWIGTLFFGLGLLVGLCVLLFPKSQAVTLDRQGFSVNALWRQHRYAWKDVSEFVAKAGLSPEAIKQMDVMSNVESVLEGKPPPLPLSATTPRTKQIYFDDGSTGKKAAFNRRVAGYNCALRNIYGLSAEQMAQLMNHWRSRAAQPDTR